MRVAIVLVLLLCRCVCASAQSFASIDYGVAWYLDNERDRLKHLPACQYSDSIGQICSGLALRYKNEAKYDSAEFVYRYALADTLFCSVPANKNALLINECELYLRRGMYLTAKDRLESIDLPDRRNRWYRRLAETLVYMSIADTTLNCYHEAIDIYGKCLAKKINVPRDERWSIYAGRGYLYAQYGKLDSALTDMRHAVSMLETSKDTLAPYHRHVVLSNMSIVEAKLGDYATAEASIDSCLDWFKSNMEGGEDHPDYVIALRKKAEIMLMKGDRGRAADIFRSYVEKERTVAVRQFASFSEQQRLDYWNNKKQLMSEVFALEDECPDFLFDVSIFRRETALLGSASADEMPYRLNLKGNDVRQSLKVGEVAVDFIRYEKDSVKWYGAIVATPLISGEGVSFVPLWKENELNGFMINGTSLKEVICSDYASDKDDVYNSIAFAKMVWQALSPYVSNATDVYFCPDGLLNLIAVECLPYEPVKDVTFHRLTSFSRLVQRDSRHTVSGNKMLAVGGLDYNEIIGRKQSDTVVVNHDAIDYLHQQIGISDNIFPNLSGTRAEIIAISDCMQATDTFSVMSEEQLKAELKKKLYTIVHLSTHGYSLNVDVPEMPVVWLDSISEDRSLLASGIALSGANVAYTDRNLEDGILSAREICDLDLRHIDLIVLSACQTGLGIVSDEGPAGLVRALKKAGANTVVASLWPMSDEATRRLMTIFYTQLAEHPGISKTKALEESQRQLTAYSEAIVKKKRRFNPAKLASETIGSENENILPYTAPQYWAGFILIDDDI